MDFDFSSVIFDEDDLDATLAEMGVQTDLAIEQQRLIAARSMLVFSCAAAVRDEDQFEALVADVPEIPCVDDRQLQFSAQFSAALASELRRQLGDSDEGRIFQRRVSRACGIGEAAA